MEQGQGPAESVILKKKSESKKFRDSIVGLLERRKRARTSLAGPPVETPKPVRY